jgi:hypothetical protein
MQYAVVPLCFGLAGGLVGRAKGNPFWLWFLISAIVPFLGLAAAFLYRREKDEPLRECPNCGQLRPLVDSMCLSCGADLSFPDEDDILVLLPGERVRARL